MACARATTRSFFALTGMPPTMPKQWRMVASPPLCPSGPPLRSSSSLNGVASSGISTSKTSAPSVTLMSTWVSRSVRSVAAPCAGVVRKRTTDGRPEANSSYRISSASCTLATSRHAPATRRSQLLPWEPSTVAQSPGYDWPEDIWSTATPHPAIAARSSSGPSATPVSASTSAAGGASRATRRSRFSTSVAIPSRTTSVNTGRPNGAGASRRTLSGLREAAEDPAAKFLAAGAPRQRELRAERPDAAALRQSLPRTRTPRREMAAPPPLGRAGAFGAAGGDERTEAKHRRDGRAAHADCA